MIASFIPFRFVWPDDNLSSRILEKSINMSPITTSFAILYCRRLSELSLILKAFSVCSWDKNSASALSGYMRYFGSQYCRKRNNMLQMNLHSFYFRVWLSSVVLKMWWSLNLRVARKQMNCMNFSWSSSRLKVSWAIVICPWTLHPTTLPLPTSPLPYLFAFSALKELVRIGHVAGIEPSFFPASACLRQCLNWLIP